MKKLKALFLLAVSLFILFLTSCQSSSKKFVTEPFEPIKINKIVSTGIQPVEVTYQKNKWPQVNYLAIEKNKMSSKNLRFAVIGDTGCRLKETAKGSSHQNCNVSNEWPYPELIQSLVKEKFSFAIHTGDYHYREHCTDEKLCPTYSKSVGYGWNAWWDDFYDPTQPLFKKTPVLLVRGNHEDCARAFQGWAPLSADNKDFNSDCAAIEPYQWIELEDMVFINFDDSAFQDRKLSPEKDRKKWLEIFNEISMRIKNLQGKKEIWFLAHKPVSGFVPDDKIAEPFAIGNFLKDLLSESGLLKQVDYFLSGHIHNQQFVVADKNMLQIIVGHSGTALDPFGRKINNQKLISSTDTKYSFGYGIFERLGFKKWKMIFKNADGSLDMVCKITNKKVSCN